MICVLEILSILNRNSERVMCNKCDPIFINEVKPHVYIFICVYIYLYMQRKKSERIYTKWLTVITSGQ